eukprot:GHVU01016487.1.p2 GENE.GHVU01016487.1~~GHVU01016487.1.p2  ORF type:complete len:110 (-),score=16.49 GHVU01016487.1:808-1137(-)
MRVYVCAGICVPMCVCVCVCVCVCAHECCIDMCVRMCVYMCVRMSAACLCLCAVLLTAYAPTEPDPPIGTGVLEVALFTKEKPLRITDEELERQFKKQFMSQVGGAENV